MSIVFLDNSPKLGGGVSAFPALALGTQANVLLPSDCASHHGDGAVHMIAFACGRLRAASIQQNMQPLAHCIYSSVATPLFRDDGVEELLAQARTANAEADITGMLLYVNRGFFQVLEGHPLRIESVFAKIGRDPRHDHVTQIIYEPIARRTFGQWTMGYPDLEKQELHAILGSNDFFSARSCLDGLEAGRAKKLLAAFATGRWRSRIQNGAALGAASPNA
jgi:hypothetical protein